MLTKNSIAQRFSRSILKLLVAFFVFVVSATTVIEVMRIERQFKSHLDDLAQSGLNALNAELNVQRRGVARTASSKLSINSLIDIDGGRAYFHHALDDLTLFNTVEDALVFDYAGNTLFRHHHHDTDWLTPSLVNDTLNTAEGVIKFSNGFFYIVEPIVYFDTVQGGIITRIPANILIQRVLQDTQHAFIINIGDTWKYINSERQGFKFTITKEAKKEQVLSDFNVSLTYSESYLFLINEITPWLTSLSLLGLLALVPSIVIARNLGRRMADPISHLATKVKSGKYPISASQEGDEIAMLADAFNDATEKLDTSNKLDLQAERISGQSQLLAIVDTVVDCIITIDIKGKIASFNPAAESLFGYRASDVIGQNVNILMPQKEASEHDQYLENYLQGSPAKIIGMGREVIAKRKDGSEFNADLSISEMFVSGEKRFTGVIRDITERKRHDQIKSEFIATVSHELRTPLTSIRGAIGLVLGKFADQIPEKSHRMLTMALRNCERLTLLINDILDIEKFESGKMTFNYSRINLNALIRRAIEDNEGFAKQHLVNLHFESHCDNAFVNADAMRLQQVMANLLSNAIKYSPSAGTVSVSLHEHSDDYRIDVTDHGPGIPTEFHAHIFERFSQADSTDTRRVGGTGLGLSISQAIVERHHGKLNFYSVPGEGATFYFTLPAEPCDQTRLIRHSALDISDMRQQVLCIDDDDHCIETLRDMLTTYADISHAFSFDSAKLALNQQFFDLVILNIDIADGSGEKLLQSPLLKDSEIIVVMQEDIEKVLPDQVKATFYKSPSSIKRLKNEVRLILNRSHKEGQLNA
ncbi:PAS domain-containing sensor histidine kinase [Enterovibrio norvegicus]|uniref:ATP-binding protein n=1 Tax=Enterovibrio norvegicus TaxID=188144 RepID=UPI000C81E0EA|nr:ATP-binding protein [Enterovibrio norvegicus]MCC4800871.1 PAS domain S-box protein [Enterovibrio norvegicus]PMI35266.1 PAS domain-containing sensor histidine kinase [Enterovibrio norvegicus]PMN46126.1 PAS domain-containing sensor histidine kinase [Enterovibrio norvegicus]TKF08581.1 PAS domain S-box protein [Enterovibrio norvegicus]TKF31262.1 PAS domain S-box protein [Enterovibrio norvegicus]